MQRHNITIHDTEYEAAIKRLPYVHPETGEKVDNFSALVRIALRSLPKND